MRSLERRRMPSICNAPTFPSSHAFCFFPLPPRICNPANDMKLVRNVRTGGADLGAEAAKRYWNKQANRLDNLLFFHSHSLYLIFMVISCYSINIGIFLHFQLLMFLPSFYSSSTFPREIYTNRYKRKCVCLRLDFE